ncbi:MAG: L,D-transpeptidase family protein [Armatimonadetes bacterium]|nr:L,D-transpeptidase family protein [Armatimonadota bacterium]
MGPGAPENALARQELLQGNQREAWDETVCLGCSVEGRPISATRLGTGPEVTLFLGVVHGDEPAGERLLGNLVELLRKKRELLKGRTAVILPIVNPDGLARRGRTNARGVDINRSFPTEDWGGEPAGSRYWGGRKPGSEPETQAIMEALVLFRPAKIVTIHAPLHSVNYDGPAEGLAAAMSEKNRYPLAPDIGYPTPGSFGTYAGKELKIPTITLELPDGPPERLWLANREALVEALVYSRSQHSQSSTYYTFAAEAAGRKRFIAVDKAGYSLYWFRNGKLAGRFDVATGICGCTPEGHFRVSDREANRRLPSGKLLEQRLSTELGDYWLGLDVRHHITGVQFGIHGTDQPESVGSQSSRGCVRLCNQDLKTFYDDVPVGTEVWIFREADLAGPVPETGG